MLIVLAQRSEAAGMSLADGTSAGKRRGAIVFDAVGCDQVTLKDVGAVEDAFALQVLLRAQWADQGAAIVRQSVPVAVILARKAFAVVDAAARRTLLRTLSLMGEHVSSQVAQDAAAVRMRAARAIEGRRRLVLTMAMAVNVVRLR